jgi:uncharacterized tellurite resistance protein B-like protein
MPTVRDRILPITDLLLGAAHADQKLDGAEEAAVRELLRELLEVEDLPSEVEERIKAFTPEKFDLEQAAWDFSSDAPIQKRHLLELVAKVALADQEIDFAEDDYLVELAECLNVPKEEYKDLAMDVEVEELKEALPDLRKGPPPPPKGKSDADGDVDVDVD